MIVWILSDGEPLPTDVENERLRRMGMLSNVLNKKNCEVHWFSSAFHHYKKEHRVKQTTSIKVSDGYHIHLIKTKGYRKNISLDRIAHYKKLAKGFNKKKASLKKPDVILATMAPLEFSQAAINYGNKHNIPVIIDIRDLWPDIYEELFPSLIKPLIKPYILFSRSKLKKILVKSSSLIGVTNEFLQYGLEIAKIDKRSYDTVFHTAYKPRSSSLYVNEFNEIWNEYNINSNNFIITFIGNFGQQFELEPIINAANRLKDIPNIKFVLCGNGKYLNDVKEKTKDNPNVVITGWIDEKKISSLLSASSIGIAPYRNSANFTKNTPNKFGEYLSASIPVMISIPGIMENLVNEYNCGFYYKNTSSLVEKINLLYKKRNLLDTLSKNAFKLFNDKFNADIVYNEFANYVIEIANKSKD